ncbi:hypothetical protein V6N11_052249 [Hibiscus sabdariffa]|uniref:Uncharacterized protein n=1 Tax=Hibiscus sabdariffa TaxID=183260 RepID=A0ABR2UA17_9ROSI
MVATTPSGGRSVMKGWAGVCSALKRWPERACAMGGWPCMVRAGGGRASGDRGCSWSRDELIELRVSWSELS